jgi:hypothetical protein
MCLNSREFHIHKNDSASLFFGTTRAGLYKHRRELAMIPDRPLASRMRVPQLWP